MSSHQPYSIRRGLYILVITAIIGLGLDLWTKHLSVENLMPPAPAYKFIPGYLHFTAVQNQGAVFGIGQGQRPIFISVSVLALGFVAYLFVRSPRRWWHDLTLGMLLGGILGNLYDRIFVGHVRDMIHALPRWPDLFPWVFNIADSLLCVSITILLISGIFMPEEKADEPVPQQS